MFVERSVTLAFARLDFVATERFLGLNILGVLACLRVILFELQLVWSVHCILARDIGTVPGQLTDKGDNLALGIRFLSHFVPLNSLYNNQLHIVAEMAVLFKGADCY